MANNQTQPIINAALVGTSIVISPPPQMQIPGHITLKSSDATRKIELSTDNGVEYFTPAVDVQSATMQIVVVNAPITNIRITGVAGDRYLVS